MKAWFGALVWVALVAAGYRVVHRLPADQREAMERSTSHLWRSAFAPSPEVEVRFEGGTFLKPGDGVYRLDEDGLTRIGEVARLEDDDRDVIAHLVFDTATGALDLREDSSFVRRTQGRSFVYCVRALITDARWAQIQSTWNGYLSQYQRQLLASLRAIVPDLLERTGNFLASEVDRALRARLPEFEALLEKFRRTIAQERGEELFLEEVWPIVRAESGPAVEAVGRDLWERAPLFALAWRAAWDSVLSDGPEKLEALWDTFLEEEVPEVLQTHEPTLRRTADRIVRRVAASDAVQREVREAARDILEDDEVRELAQLVLRDLVVNNPRLLEFLEEQRDDPSVRRRLQQVNDRLQVFLNDFGNLLVYADDGRELINPDLAKLLRVLLLQQDQRFLFFERGTGAPWTEGRMLRGHHDDA